MFLWRELGINSWPTFAIVGPNGKLLAQISGEGRRKVLEDLLYVLVYLHVPWKSSNENFSVKIKSSVMYPYSNFKYGFLFFLFCTFLLLDENC